MAAAFEVCRNKVMPVPSAHVMRTVPVADMVMVYRVCLTGVGSNAKVMAMFLLRLRYCKGNVTALAYFPCGPGQVLC